ncbi:MAG: glycosyltransferase [Burkholderiales bacterium]|nr:glycosyltransferase [Burkholderiales bacterium]
MNTQAFTPGEATRVWACVVCWRAAPDSIAQLVELLAPQVECIVLVDNAASVAPGLQALAAPNVSCIASGGNKGTAGAMNLAWQRALAAGAHALISFDQDSRPAPGMVGSLLAAYASQASQAAPFAAIGPAWTDARSGRAMRVLLPVSGSRRHAAPDAAGVVASDHVITSGCLIPSAAYLHVGPYDEGLFLDYVDIEWCLRARSLGWQVGIDTACRMSHAIGDRVISFAGRSLMLHAPVRNYLLLRNHLLLWPRRFIGRMWLVSDLLQVAARMAASLLLAPPRLQRLRWLARGLRDGLRGRGGPPP